MSTIPTALIQHFTTEPLVIVENLRHKHCKDESDRSIKYSDSSRDTAFKEEGWETLELTHKADATPIKIFSGYFHIYLTLCVRIFACTYVHASCACLVPKLQMVMSCL